MNRIPQYGLTAYVLNEALQNCNETSICNARFYCTLVYLYVYVYFAYFTPVWMWLLLVYFIHLHAFTFVYPTLSTSTCLGVPHLHAFNRYLPVFTSITPLHAFTCSTTLTLFTYMGHTGVRLCCAYI